MFPNWPYYTPEKGDKVRVMDECSLFGTPLETGRPYFVQYVWHDAVYVSADEAGSSMWCMVKADRVLPWTNAKPRQQLKVAS